MNYNMTDAVAPAKEQTFIMIKPDGVQRGLIGQIISRFENKGFKLCAMKLCTPNRTLFEQHYAHLSSKRFFSDLIDYASSGPVCAMVWEGDNAVATSRKMLGATKPSDSEPGTIRGDLSIHVSRNIIHGSDSVEAANSEIDLWFKDNELNTWIHHSNDWIYDSIRQNNTEKTKVVVTSNSLITTPNEGETSKDRNRTGRLELGPHELGQVLNSLARKSDSSSLVKVHKVMVKPLAPSKATPETTALKSAHKPTQ